MLRKESKEIIDNLIENMNSEEITYTYTQALRKRSAENFAVVESLGPKAVNLFNALTGMRKSSFSSLEQRYLEAQQRNLTPEMREEAQRLVQGIGKARATVRSHSQRLAQGLGEVEDMLSAELGEFGDLKRLRARNRGYGELTDGQLDLATILGVGTGKAITGAIGGGLLGGLAGGLAGTLSSRRDGTEGVQGLSGLKRGFVGGFKRGAKGGALVGLGSGLVKGHAVNKNDYKLYNTADALGTLAQLGQAGYAGYKQYEGDPEV